VRAGPVRNPHAHESFRRLPIRTPRQAVLRTSSWLSDLFANRPCGLPTNKQHDSSNRRLPPNRTACTRTSCVPGSLPPLSQRGRPTENKAPCGATGGTDVSRRPRTASAGRRDPRFLPDAFRPLGGAWAFSSHGVHVTEPLTPLSRSTRSSSRLIHLRGCCTLAVRPSRRRGGTGRRMGQIAKTTVVAVS